MFFKFLKADLALNSTLLRFDLWVLPFLNVYGLVGRTKGDVSLNFNLGGAGNTIDSALCNDRPVAERPECLALVAGVNYVANNGVAVQNVRVKYDAPTYGGGLSVAGGIHDFFGMYDVKLYADQFRFRQRPWRVMGAKCTLGLEWKCRYLEWAGLGWRDVSRQ